MVMHELPDWALRLLGNDGASRIEAAIAEAESRTSGEIVPMVVRRSSTVGHVPLLAFALLLLFVVLAEIPAYLSLLGGPEWLWLGTSWLVAGGVALGLSRVDAVARVLTPRSDQIQQVELRAELEFFENEVGQTEQDTGILLFVSLMEHRAVVLADRAIAEKLDPEVWQEVMDLMLQGVSRGDLADGMTQAIARCGDLLAPHFPLAEGDENELRDHLIVKQ
jgi:putative membrane protein